MLPKTKKLPFSKGISKKTTFLSFDSYSTIPSIKSSTKSTANQATSIEKTIIQLTDFIGSAHFQLTSNLDLPYDLTQSKNYQSQSLPTLNPNSQHMLMLLSRNNQNKKIKQLIKLKQGKEELKLLEFDHHLNACDILGESHSFGK